MISQSSVNKVTIIMIFRLKWGKTYKSKTNTLTNWYVIRRTIQVTYYKIGASFSFQFLKEKKWKNCIYFVVPWNKRTH